MKQILVMASAAALLAAVGCADDRVGDGNGAGGEGEAAGADIQSNDIAEGAAAPADPAPVATGDPVDDDAAYIHLLGMVRGHLAAFIELYRAGAYDMAQGHVKHPESELYVALAPAIAARSAPPFADALSALADAAQTRGDVESAYEAARAAIRAAGPQDDIRATVLGVAKLVASAAEEFEEGVAPDGAIIAAHEYQDAFGFLSAAREMLAEARTDDINEVEAIAVSHEQIDMALGSFDGLVVETTDGDAATLYAAAQRIERVGTALRP